MLSRYLISVAKVPTVPHLVLPPCRGGGAYAPITRTII